MGEPFVGSSEEHMKETYWTGTYKDGWNDLIVSDEKPHKNQLPLFDCGEDYSAFEHPAKVARALIKRIYEHLAKHYGLQPGSVVLDPFAGVGLHGLDCLLMGYHFIGIELEPKFHTLSRKNAEYWRHKFGPQTGSVTLLQGDSRQLRRILQAANITSCVSSPPYANGLGHACEYRDPEKAAKDAQRDIMQAKNRQAAAMQYGTTPGQLGAMPPGACISSPPYEAQASNCATNHGKEGKPQWKAGGIAAREPHLVPGYGETPGNIGNESQETFWSASSLIMAELAALLPPGAIAAWIVKAFVRNKTVVDFPGNWLKLCQHHGFTLIERIYASLIDHHGEEPTLWGETVTRATKRSSFFRQLYEKRYPDLAIDHEVVLITQRGIA